MMAFVQSLCLFHAMAAPFLKPHRRLFGNTEFLHKYWDVISITTSTLCTEIGCNYTKPKHTYDDFENQVKILLTQKQREAHRTK